MRTHTQKTEGSWLEYNLQKLNDSNLAKFQLDSCPYKSHFTSVWQLQGEIESGQSEIF